VSRAGIAVAAVLAFASAVACSAGTRSELTIFAAASLADVMSDLEGVWERAKPDLPLTISTGSSAALRTQIEEGAPADVFLSADTSNPQALLESGRLADDPVVFASNRLTVVVPRGNPASIETPLDLARDGVAIVAAGEEVPIQRYAVQAVQNLALVPGYPQGFAERYTQNIVSREDNVGGVLAKIELGEADAAIVYVTDAAGSDVEVIPIPEEANVIADYAAAVVADSDQQQAESFLAWLIGDEGRRILAAHGFGEPN
jgi:molybdate transport system substrate-binding protein